MIKYMVIAILVAVAAANQPPSSTFSAKMKIPKVDTIESRIIGGMTVSIENVPYQVALLHRDSHICGGVIISPRWVLTAAHCAKQNTRSLRVRAGSSQSICGGSIHTIAEKYVHEDFYSTDSDVLVNDIALLLISNKFSFDNTRQAIEIFSKNEELKEGDLGQTSGWGRTSDGGPTSKILRLVTVPVISKAQCSTIYSHLGALPPGQFCAGYKTGGRDSCAGDSGGPFAIGGKLAGIVSWGIACGFSEYPGVYTEVAAYHDWIMRHIESHSQDQTT